MRVDRFAGSVEGNGSNPYFRNKKNDRIAFYTLAWIFAIFSGRTVPKLLRNQINEVGIFRRFEMILLYGKCVLVATYHHILEQLQIVFSHPLSLGTWKWLSSGTNGIWSVERLHSNQLYRRDRSRVVAMSSRSAENVKNGQNSWRNSFRCDQTDPTRMFYGAQIQPIINKNSLKQNNIFFVA